MEQNFSESCHFDCDGKSFEVDVEIGFYEPPALKRRLESIHKQLGPMDNSADILYPHELIMLTFVQRKPIKEIISASYWRYQVPGSDAGQILCSLFGRGYIEFADLRTSLELQSMAVIQNELKLLGEKCGGSKKNLVERLLGIAELSDLEKKYTKTCYRLSQKGLDALAQHPYVKDFIYPKYNMDVWDIWTGVQNNGNKVDYREIVWQRLLAQSQKHFEAQNFGMYRCARFAMYEFMNKQSFYEAAFKHICEVVAYDLSPCSNGFVTLFRRYTPDSVNYLKDYFFEKEIPNPNPRFCGESKIIRPTLSTPNLILESMGALKKKLELSDDGFREKLHSCFSEIIVPYTVFGVVECVDYVVYSLEGNKEKIDELYLAAYKREEKKWLKK